MPEIKAIETVYAGYKFRSRLEARWAVFFDTLGVKWEYEKEGYDLGGTWYLPDFWLPDHKRWIEIKGQKPTGEEVGKIETLYLATAYPACIFHGLPGENEGTAYYSCLHSSNGGNAYKDDVIWKQCPACHTIDINIQHGFSCSLYNEDNGEFIDSCGCSPESYEKNIRDRGLMGLFHKGEKYDAYIREEVNKIRYRLENKDAMTPLLERAYTAARQARFEHGEKG